MCGSEVAIMPKIAPHPKRQFSQSGILYAVTGDWNYPRYTRRSFSLQFTAQHINISAPEIRSDTGTADTSIFTQFESHY